jgi:hypothetical protein
MGTVAILAGAAFSCCVAIQLYSLPATGLLSSAQTVQEPPDSCPITKPPQLPFIPPRAGPYPSDGRVWIGSPKLWTNIPRDGIWRGLPQYTPDDTRFRQKLFWWSKGYDSALRIGPSLRLLENDSTGQRLHCLLTRTQMLDGPVTESMRSSLQESLFRHLAAGKSLDTTMAKS